MSETTWRVIGYWCITHQVNLQWQTEHQQGCMLQVCVEPAKKETWQDFQTPSTQQSEQNLCENTEWKR